MTAMIKEISRGCIKCKKLDTAQHTYYESIDIKTMKRYIFPSGRIGTKHRLGKGTSALSEIFKLLTTINVVTGIETKTTSNI